MLDIYEIPTQGDLDELLKVLEDGYVCGQVVEVRDKLAMRESLQCRDPD